MNAVSPEAAVEDYLKNRNSKYANQANIINSNPLNNFYKNTLTKGERSKQHLASTPSHYKG